MGVYQLVFAERITGRINQKLMIMSPTEGNGKGMNGEGRECHFSGLTLMYSFEYGNDISILTYSLTPSQQD